MSVNFSLHKNKFCLLLCMFLFSCNVAGSKEDAVLIAREIVGQYECLSVKVDFSYSSPDDDNFSRAIHVGLNNCLRRGEHLSAADLKEIATLAIQSYPGELVFDSVYVVARSESESRSIAFRRLELVN